MEAPKDAGPLQAIMAEHSAKETAYTEEHHSTSLCTSSIYHNSKTVGQDPFNGSRSDLLEATYFIILFQIHISTTYVATLRILPISQISILTLQTR